MAFRISHFVVLVVGAVSFPVAVSKPPPNRTVMAFISTAPANWVQCAQFLGKGGDGEGQWS